MSFLRRMVRILGFPNRGIFHVTDKTFDQCAASTCFRVRVASNILLMLGLLLVMIMIGTNLSNRINHGYSADLVESCNSIFMGTILFASLAIAIIGLVLLQPDRGLMEQTVSSKTLVKFLKEKGPLSKPCGSASFLQFHKQVRGPVNLIIHAQHLVTLGSTAVNLVLINFMLVLVLLHWDSIFIMKILLFWFGANLCWMVADLFFNRTDPNRNLNEGLVKLLGEPSGFSFSAVLPFLCLTAGDKILVKIGCTFLNAVTQLISKILRASRRMD